jgi:hypothetical protein
MGLLTICKKLAETPTFTAPVSPAGQRTISAFSGTRTLPPVAQPHHRMPRATAEEHLR